MLADLINNEKIPRFVKYILITVLIGFLEFIFISVAVNGVTKFAMPVGIILAIIFFGLYIYMIIKIKKYNYVNKEDN